ncbi:uncharacterized protein METZ01_LOCUS141764, partial [marine metagenome]
RLGGLSTQITKHARPLIKSALTQSPTTAALISGRLREEMGIVNADSELDQIFQAISETVNVTVSPAKKRGISISMKIRLTAVPFDFDSVVGDVGSYVTGKGATIPWFKWLTAAGDRIIVRDYDVEGGHPESSRTGDMIMKKGKKGWRVPPEFAGSPKNNFVTEATDSILPELGRYIQTTAIRML